jgi:Carboxypeptidase regulatory-like domain
MKSPLSTPLRRLLALTTTAVLAAAAFVAGAVPAHAAVYTVKGTITGKLTSSATPTVLGDVWVEVEPAVHDWWADRIGTWTGADGKFSLTVPAEGSYKVRVSCGSSCEATYADEYYNNHSGFGDADPVTVSAAAPTATANVELSAFGKISGRVTNKSGLPLTQVTVSAYSQSGDGGDSGVTPDANGYYTLNKVPTGMVNLTVRDESGKHLYAQQSWNGTSGVEKYGSFTMPTGAVLNNVNFALNPQTVFDATVTDSAGKAIPNVGYLPLEYNEVTGKWDGPQMGPLLSDDAGKVYWNLIVGKKYKFCFNDWFYEQPREYRYVAECYDNVANEATAKIVTPTSLGQRITATVQLATAGKSLTQGDAFVHGGNQPGQTVRVDPGAWGPAPVTLSYQWSRYKDGTATTVIAGATSSSYVLTEADRGSYVSVKITGSKPGYVTSSQTESAGKVGDPAVTSSKPLTLVGTPSVGSTLTADFGTLTPDVRYPNYEWLVNGVRDDRSHDKTFKLASTDAGKKITVRVRAYSEAYESYRAQATSATVTGGVLTTAAPTISGTAKVGYKLTANPGTWGPAPVTLAYQWFRSGVAITGATASTYTQMSTDLGKTLTVRVTGSKLGYTTVAKTSTATAAVVVGTLTAPVPTITGTAKVGQKLTANPGTWGPAPVTLAYQWFRSGVAITGATASTYAQTSTDLGKTLTVKVTGSKAGYTTVAKTSAATVAVVAGTLTAPTPTITGSAMQGYKLTANPGTWGPAPVTLAYQWFRSGVAITGATASTYTQGTLDVGKTITVRVTGSKAGYTTAAKTSAATAVVKGRISFQEPTITGTAKVGSTLTANIGTWGPAPVAITYKWQVGNATVDGVSTYTPTAADVGKAIRVWVTGTKTGYNTVVRVSAPTAAVAP